MFSFYVIVFILSVYLYLLDNRRINVEINNVISYIIIYLPNKNLFYIISLVENT